MTDVFTAPVLVAVRRVLCFFPGRGWTLGHAKPSPWLVLEIDPAWGREAAPANGRRKFAIWINTGAVHRVQDHAVEDDPIDLEALDPERDRL